MRISKTSTAPQVPNLNEAQVPKPADFDLNSTSLTASGLSSMGHRASEIVASMCKSVRMAAAGLTVMAGAATSFAQTRTSEDAVNALEKDPLQQTNAVTNKGTATVDWQNNAGQYNRNPNNRNLLSLSFEKNQGGVPVVQNLPLLVAADVNVVRISNLPKDTKMVANAVTLVIPANQKPANADWGRQPDPRYREIFGGVAAYEFSAPPTSSLADRTMENTARPTGLMRFDIYSIPPSEKPHFIAHVLPLIPAGGGSKLSSADVSRTAAVMQEPTVKYPIETIQTYIDSIKEIASIYKQVAAQYENHPMPFMRAIAKQLRDAAPTLDRDDLAFLVASIDKPFSAVPGGAQEQRNWSEQETAQINNWIREFEAYAPVTNSTGQALK